MRKYKIVLIKIIRKDAVTNQVVSKKTKIIKKCSIIENKEFITIYPKSSNPSDSNSFL